MCNIQILFVAIKRKIVKRWKKPSHHPIQPRSIFEKSRKSISQESEKERKKRRYKEERTECLCIANAARMQMRKKRIIKDRAKEQDRKQAQESACATRRLPLALHRIY